jgi:outer membrane receptor protein involved in Fe transport
MTRLRLATGVATAVACLVAGASAHSVEEIVVHGDSRQTASSWDEIRAYDYQLRPHSTLQDILNNVPGLIVRQHQGGGKATQYLIRGFDADHGSDFLVTVDGMPVNLVSHAHGQGYADLNFVIPETVDRLQLHKGPYFVEHGDFDTAGALNLVLKDEFEENFVLAEGGSFDRQRYVAGLSPRVAAGKVLLAAQAAYSNGPFEHPEHMARYNGFAKYSLEPSNDLRLQAAAGLYQADWDASGQIPSREASAGRLDRFGAIDPTEGGRTDRETLDLDLLWKPSRTARVTVEAWAQRYALRLYSNFTFFQDTGLRFQKGRGGDIVDTAGAIPIAGAPYVPGDGIEQHDTRWLYGGRAAYARDWTLLGRAVTTTLGAETRHDEIDVAVHRQVERDRFFTVTETFVQERTFAGYLGQEIDLTEWLRFTGGVRGDAFFFDVQDRLPRQAPDPDFEAVPIDGSESDSIVSTKANLTIAPPASDTEVYLNFGTGFHSNDARAVVQGADDPNLVPLARATGYEVGARTWRVENLDLAAALWLIDLESEITFCGDCGSIEGVLGSFDASGPTRRWGVDFESRYRLTEWLTADYDLSWADPRYKDGAAVPIAPTLFMNGGLTLELPSGFSAAARVRFLDDRPATETRTLTARGYLLVDLFAKYRWRNVELGVDLLNVGDFDWQEAVFADTSCTAREVRRGRCPSAQDIHFTPGDPLAARGRVTVFF